MPVFVPLNLSMTKDALENYYLVDEALNKLIPGLKTRKDLDDWIGKQKGAVVMVRIAFQRDCGAWGYSNWDVISKTPIPWFEETVRRWEVKRASEG